MIRHMSRRIRELQKASVWPRAAKKRTGVHMCNEATCAAHLIEPLAKLKAYERKNCNGETMEVRAEQERTKAMKRRVIDYLGRIQAASSRRRGTDSTRAHLPLKSRASTRGRYVCERWSRSKQRADCARTEGHVGRGREFAGDANMVQGTLSLSAGGDVRRAHAADDLSNGKEGGTLVVDRPLRVQHHRRLHCVDGALCRVLQGEGRDLTQTSSSRSG